MFIDWIKRKLHIMSPTEPAYAPLDTSILLRVSNQEGVEERRLIDPDKFIEQSFNIWTSDSDEVFLPLTDVVAALKQTPTEEIVGYARWNGERGEFTCSHCGESAPLDGYLDSKYCYECGYKMLNSSKWEEKGEEDSNI